MASAKVQVRGFVSMGILSPNWPWHNLAAGLNNGKYNFDRQR